MATRRAAEGATPIHYFRNKYRPEEFIVPGQDNNGNSIRLHCRVVPLLDRAIDILFSSRRFPFKSKGDLMRWCVKTGVERLEGMEPVTGSVLMQVEAMMGILRDEELNHAFLTVFQSMVVTVGMHVQAQALGEARRVVTMMHSQISKMEEGYWRSRYLKELDSKFGYLLSNSVTGAPMAEFDDHGDDNGGIDE